jgi:hypothetical protein
MIEEVFKKANIWEAVGRRRSAGGRRRSAGGRRQEAGGL